MNSKWLIILTLALAACGQRQEMEISSVVISDRLSNQRINSFAQDSDGHIWIATGRGLNKYVTQDYYQYFCAEDSLSLPNNQVNNVFFQRNGRLWASTMNGVAWLTPQDRFRRVEIPDGNRNISTLMENREGQMLLSNGSKIFVYDESSERLRTVIRDLNSFGSPAIIMGSDNRIWVNNGMAVSVYSASTFELLDRIETHFICYHICEVGNELWLSGMGGLDILDTRSLQWKPLPKAISRTRGIMDGDVDLIYAIDNRNILLNVIGKGMYYYSRAREEVLFEEDGGFPFSIPDAEILTIFRDKDHNLWFGTTDQGYGVSYEYKDQFNSNKFITDAFAHKTVVSVTPDHSGNVWICTQHHGLYCYNIGRKQLKGIDVSPLIPDRKVGIIRCSNVFCDADGDLWLMFTGKYRVLRCRYDGQALHPLDQVDFPAPLIAIAQDDQKNIWLGGWSPELMQYNPVTKSATMVPIALQTDWTAAIELFMLEPGRLLAGSIGQPVVSVNTYTREVSATHMTEEELSMLVRRSVLIPNVIYKDSEGDIWVGTTANGLLRYNLNDKSSQMFADVPCLDITSIQEDRQGNVWVSTLNGLAKYDRTVNRMVTYFENDGIGGNQFSDRASCLLEDGTLVFGGTHGLTWFNPLESQAVRTVPLVFESLSIHNKLVAPSAGGPIETMLSQKPEITIRPDQNAFDISFAALDYSEFEQIRYAYKLEGFDQDWVKIDTRHHAYFANIPPGHYTLRVRIADGSHTVASTQETLLIHVLPPWYKTWWAYLLFILAGLLLLAIAYSFYRHLRRVRKEAAKRIREVRREREKAEEAERAEKELNKIQMNYFSNVAHEFRTPLTMIAGPASQLATAEGIRGQDRKLVDIIRRNATWMLSLVNQLLDFNRIGNRKLQMKVAKMDIVEPLREIAELFGYNAQSKGIELSTHGLEDSFVMWVDGDKVQKIVMNLLSNALKFTPPGGKVSLSFDVISREEAAGKFPLTEADNDGQYACISVADSGCGIPEEEMESIFERFYQTGSGKENYGSGIGLYYARALCTLHHGYIKAWNQESGGALFSVVLPVSASSYSEDERSTEAPELQLHTLLSTQTPDTSATPEEEGERKQIVIVDDDIDIANYLKILLKPTYKVSVYFDATSALKGMEEEGADLVISDVVMPGMNGYQLCENIKSSLQLSHIPVVLVTAKVAVENQVQGLDKGADAYVTKPFQPAYLLALVKSLLANREKLHRQLGTVTTTEEIAPEALSPRDAAFMKELYELMEKELANTDLDILRMTEMMKISRTKFYYKVKGLTGENPSVFFKRYKLNRAAELLKEGKYNMSEIAYMTGFNTLSHFSTSFKKQFGVPPSEYVG